MDHRGGLLLCNVQLRWTVECSGTGKILVELDAVAATVCMKAAALIANHQDAIMSRGSSQNFTHHCNLEQQQRLW